MEIYALSFMLILKHIAILLKTADRVSFLEYFGNNIENIDGRGRQTISE